MRPIFLFMAGLSVSMVVASCAPKPAPIMPEPVYDKYGNAVMETQVCRVRGETVDTNSTLARLPICEDSCGPGEQLNPTISIAAQQRNPQCTPIPQDRDDQQPDLQRGGKN